MKFVTTILTLLLTAGMIPDDSFKGQLERDKTILVLNRPIDSEKDWPAELKLMKNGKFEYYSIPYWSCWNSTELSGDWKLFGDTLRLDPTKEFFQDFVDYKIDGDRVSLIGENEEVYPGWMEPVLVTEKSIMEELKKTAHNKK